MTVTGLSTEKKHRAEALEQSATDWAWATTNKDLKRAGDIMRDKKRAIVKFFAATGKEADKITSADVREWHRALTEKYSAAYIYALMSHLSSYFEWLRTIPAFARFIKINPVSLMRPKAPPKYNSPKPKSLTDGELAALWKYLEDAAADDEDLVAVRDYAIFRLFTATGMRREEIIDLGAADVRIEAGMLLIHGKIKGGIYEWRTVADAEATAAFMRYLRLAKREKTLGSSGKALWIRLDRGANAAALDARAVKKEEEPRLTSHGFADRMKKSAAAAGIEKFHLHRLRHTFARIVAEDTGSIIETQDALGHRSPQTTLVYVRSIKFKKDKYGANIRQRVESIKHSEEE